MTTPMERALKNLEDATSIRAPMAINTGVLQGLCALLAAEIIADAIKEAASPKEETATIHNFTLNLPKGNREIYEEIQQLLAQRAQNPLLKLQESDHPGDPDSQNPQQYTGTHEESEEESPQL